MRGKEKKRFSIRIKMVMFFGLPTLAALSLLGFFAIRSSQKAVIEKVEAHLEDKALDTASIIDGKVSVFFKTLEGITRIADLRDESVSQSEKQRILDNEKADK